MSEATETAPHIAVCICTFKRPAMLKQLLSALEQQKTDSRFDYSITVVDNDVARSSEQMVVDFQRTSAIPIRYEVEPEQNIALARNKAVANSSGDFIAFIDDDELPGGDWLFQLLQTCTQYGADGVLGSVKPKFIVQPPDWALQAGIFDRPNSRDYDSGSLVHWSQTGAGNALVRREVLTGLEGPFAEKLGSGGEDIDFFRRAVENDKIFVWCAEATAYETVPAERTRVSFQLKRALLRGKASLSTAAGGKLGIVKSISACGLYSVMLPIYFFVGRGAFLKNLIRLCDHLGKLLGVCGIDLVGQKYVIE